MTGAARFVDRLSARGSYAGTDALAYDAWMSPGRRFPCTTATSLPSP